MTNKRFNELLEEARKKMYEQGKDFYYVLGWFLFTLKNEKLNLRPSQYDRLVTIQIEERW